MNREDTIFAVATPAGRGGVAVLRVSGLRAAQSLACLTAPRPLPRPREATQRAIIDPASRETLDYVLVIFFPAPKSYTGEDVVEYHLHGGLAVVESVLNVLSRQEGHRLAEHGEFTRRAFENGKIDLTAAEAVADLIEAQTHAQAAQALAQMEGGLARLYEGWRESLIRTLAWIEAEIDFPDEDLPHDLREALLPRIDSLLSEIRAHLDDGRRGERLREGVQVVILGAPNAGKSSLLNALARRDVAIVSDMAGTTRDLIEVSLNVGGYPVIVCDTAGLRSRELLTGEQAAIESEGIRRAVTRAARADIRLLVCDATEGEPDISAWGISAETSPPSDSVRVWNKIDALPHEKRATLPADALAISALTGEGMSALIQCLEKEVIARAGRREAPALTRQRHRTALESCVQSLERARNASLPELSAEDVRLAARALGSLTGRVDVEDVLDVIFRDFCIGK